MLNRTKVYYRKTKKFVQKHPTLVACVLTGTVSWKLSQRATIKGVLRETTQQVYRWGYERGELEMQLLAFLEFIEASDLQDDFADFVNENFAAA